MKRTSILLLALWILLTGCAAPKPSTQIQAEKKEEPMPIAIETVKTDAFSMDYFRFGTGKRTLVILPGLSVQSVMGSAQAVAEAYAPLAEAFTVYLFDRRKELPPVYSVADMAADTAAAFQKLGLEKVSLFGASQGGMIAQQIAVDHPELVEKLVLGSTCAAVDEARFEVIGSWVRLARAKDREGLYLSFGEALYPRDVFEASRDLLRQMAQAVTEEELARFVILAEGTLGFDAEDRLENIACPVLVLGAADDRVLGPDAANALAEKLGGKPGFQLYMYDGYGHAAFDTAPDYKARMLQFLTADSAA